MCRRRHAREVGLKQGAAWVLGVPMLGRDAQPLEDAQDGSGPMAGTAKIRPEQLSTALIRRECPHQMAAAAELGRCRRREETSKYTDLMANGRRGNFLTWRQSVITFPSADEAPEGFRH